MNIKEKDYRISGYHRIAEINNLGDEVIIFYYEKFNNGLPQNLKVRETKTYDRSFSANGYSLKITCNMEWVSDDPNISIDSKETIEYYNEEEVAALNTKSRMRLLSKVKKIIIDTIGFQKGSWFISTLFKSMSYYERGMISQLISDINNSTLTQELKNTLVDILNQTYSDNVETFDYSN